MCCGNEDRWVVTYPAVEANPETGAAAQPVRTEEFVDVGSARAAAQKVPGASYDRKSATSAA